MSDLRLSKADDHKSIEKFFRTEGRPISGHPISTEDHVAIEKYFSVFSGFLNQMPLAFYYSRIIEGRWTIQRLSDGITALLGYPKEDLIGKIGFDGLIVDSDFYKTLPIRAEQQTGEYIYLYTLRTATNKPKRVIDKGFFILDPEGRLQGALGVVMDFTLETGFDILDYLPHQAESPPTNSGTLAQIVGFSQPMKKVIERIKIIAPNQGHLLIQGESGTGKELTARAIHDLSLNHGRPLIAINCGAISEYLMESEFFGHVKGAFSGATENRKGYLDVVDNGTLFLDEVGEMPASMQVKLLRVLDGYGYTPVGSTKNKKTRFRLICASNRDLESLVAAGLMRLDFYHRIKQLTITLPPLRDRAEDIEPLINHFAERYFNDNHIAYPEGKSILPAEVLTAFKAHQWPGNVRELHHAVIKYLSMGEIEFTTGPGPKTLEREPDQMMRPPIAYDGPETLGEFEKTRLIRALNQSGWDTAKAALILGKTRRTVQRKMLKYGLK